MPGFDGIHNSVMKVVSDKYCGRWKCIFEICFSHGIYHKIVREKTTMRQVKTVTYLSAY